MTACSKVGTQMASPQREYPKEYTQFLRYQPQMLEFVQAVRSELKSFGLTDWLWEVDRLEFRIRRTHRQQLDITFEVIDFGRSIEGRNKAELRQAFDPGHFDEEADYDIRGKLHLWAIEDDHSKSGNRNIPLGIDTTWLDYDDVVGWERQFDEIKNSKEILTRRIKHWHDTGQ